MCSSVYIEMREVGKWEERNDTLNEYLLKRRQQLEKQT